MVKTPCRRGGKQKPPIPPNIFLRPSFFRDCTSIHNYWVSYKMVQTHSTRRSNGFSKPNIFRIKRVRFSLAIYIVVTLELPWASEASSISSTMVFVTSSSHIFFGKSEFLFGIVCINFVSGVSLCHKSCDLKVANVATSILLANNLGVFSKQLRRPRYPRTLGVPEVSNGLWVNLTSETKKLVQRNKRKCGKWIVWWLSHPLVGWNGTKLQQSSINFHGNGYILDYNLTILHGCAPIPPNNSFYSTYGSCNHLLKQSFSVTRPSSLSRIHAKNITQQERFRWLCCYALKLQGGPLIVANGFVTSISIHK